MLKTLFDEIGDFIGQLLQQEEVWIILMLLGLGLGGTLVFPLSSDIAGLFLKFLGLTWWFWAFLILFFTFKAAWVAWRQEIFSKSIEWGLLEIVIPREHDRTPKAMEQTLRALHSLGNYAGDLEEIYWDGEITRWINFEMTSFGGTIRLYVRFYKKQRQLIESAFFAHYPNIELVETEDYMDRLPQTTREMYVQGKDLWATELTLFKKPAYPIVSYTELINEIETERRVDPISTILEILSKVEKGQFVGIQIIIAPILDYQWRDKWESVVEELKEKTSGKTVTESEEGSSSKISTRTPGETDTIKAIEENLSKPAFNTLIRYIYISPIEIYYDSFPRRGLRGAFQQYNSFGLNSFGDNVKVSTRTRIWHWPHAFPKLRAEFRKQRILYTFLGRQIPPETFLGRLLTSHPLNFNFASNFIQLNTESLATIFHPPTSTVLTAPHIPRAESKRGGPPTDLPIYSEEEDIEKYQ